MKIYFCEFCNYQTTLLANFKRHKQTKRHHQNIINKNKGSTYSEKGATDSENGTTDSEKGATDLSTYKFNNNQIKAPQLVCKYCDASYSSQKCLNRHLKSCTIKIINQKDNMIKELKKIHNNEITNNTIEIEKYKDKINEYEEQISNYKNQLTEYDNKIKQLILKLDDQVAENRQITKSVLKIAENQSLQPKKQTNNNHTHFIINNYKDAPNLEFPIVNWSNERMDNYVKLGPVRGLSKIITDHWADNIPPEQRSIWNIDYSRNKFLIRIEDAWVIDVNGSKFQEITIDKIYSIFIDYMKNSDRQAFEMVDLMSFMCDIRNKDMGLKALKDAGKYLIYDNEKYKHETSSLDI